MRIICIAMILLSGLVSSYGLENDIAIPHTVLADRISVHDITVIRQGEGGNRPLPIQIKIGIPIFKLQVQISRI